jgi:propanol-preferring alcohol dehydrogenase
MGFSMLATEGAYVSSGLIGKQIKIPLFPLVSREYQYYGSFWGSYNDLRDVMELAKKGLIKHNVQKFGLSEANDALDQLRREDFGTGGFGSLDITIVIGRLFLRYQY